MKMFEKPIPGQSLTDTPKNAPYERPPEISKPEEALKMHMQRLSDPEKMGAVMDMLETGLDVVTITEGYLRSAVANGIHSVDVSMLVAPAIHKYIKTTADKLGIDYEEGLEDVEEKISQEKSIRFAKAKNKLAKEKNNLKETPSVKNMVSPPEEGPVDTAPKGFIRRRK